MASSQGYTTLLTRNSTVDLMSQMGNETVRATGKGRALGINEEEASESGSSLLRVSIAR